MKNFLFPLGTIVLSVQLLGSAIASPPALADCGSTQQSSPACTQLERITIFGSALESGNVAGGASRVTKSDLEEFEISDVVRALRRVPGVSLQLEDGWALRPNISIRGTASERSSRITLLEDNVLIAPAPYSAPSAYYFPTFGRINAVEVLKGPASITQGPYTVGGAVNLVSTPVPNRNSGFLQGEYGSDSTWRLHGWYGSSSDRVAYLVETHQWKSDGYQTIDQSNHGTGLDKQDYLAKLAFYSDTTAKIYQSFEIKLQSSEEDSQQSYLGLTDQDFAENALRRYGASELDAMHNEHKQIVLTWHLESPSGSGLTLAAYNNQFERAWYKTEGVDFDGSSNPESFNSTGWANIIAAVNQGAGLGELTVSDLQAFLHGADTAAGAIQIRNNAREYYSRGVQLTSDTQVNIGNVTHQLQLGLRYHEDEEDRLQRNDTYQQTSGRLVLSQMGREGNAGNQVQNAQAWSAYILDRIEFDRWTLTPGLRYENIQLSRTRFFTNGDNPASRNDSNFRDTRDNRVEVWLPGVGAILAVNPTTRLIGGIHRGFAAPGNEPGVDPEKSTNYELGIRYDNHDLAVEAMYFFNDYQNLVGLCTNSSGSNCEPGSAFNGKGVQIPGLELGVNGVLFQGQNWTAPFHLTYTWMNAEFQTNFESEFFGQVHKGDPVPYVPDNQLWASIGLAHGPWSFYLSGSFMDSICTKASCSSFETAESSLTFDMSAHYEVNSHLTLYAVAENLADELYLAAREPYGARANKPRTFMAGAKINF